MAVALKNDKFEKATGLRAPQVQILYLALFLIRKSFGRVAKPGKALPLHGSECRFKSVRAHSFIRILLSWPSLVWQRAAIP